MSKAKNAISKRGRLRESAHERRMTAARRRNNFVELFVSGFSYAAIAEQVGMTANAVRHIVNKEIAERRLDAPEQHVHLQVERLNMGIRTIQARLSQNDLGAVDRLLKVIAQLDRYHLPAQTPAPVPAALPAPSPAPLALTHAPEAPLEPQACAENSHSRA